MPQVSPAVLSGAIVVYVALQIGVGLYLSRNVKTERDFFLAGQKFGLLPVAVSIFATWFGAETIMGSAGAIAEDGLAGARAEPFGYALCLFAMAFLIAGAFRARGYANIADFFRDRFDHRSELATAVIMIIVSTIWAAAQLLALAALLQSALHVPVGLTLVGSTLVVIIYTSLAGIEGDIWTDCIQAVVLVTGLVLMLFAVASAMGGFGPMLASIEPGQLKLLGEGETWLGQIDTWTIPILGSLVTQEVIARFLSTKSPAHARNATLMAGGMYLALGFVPVLIALAGVHYLSVGEDSAAFLPSLAAQTLSPFLYVLFAGALMSAVMSTTNSNVLSVSSLMSLNVLSRIHASASDRTRVLVARATTVGAGLVAYLIAASGQSIVDLIQLTSVFGQAGILVAVLAGLWSSYGGGRAAWWAIIACVIVNVWTLAIAPLMAAQQEGATFGEAFAQLVAGDAPTMEGYFLLSVVVSALAYAAGAEMENRAVTPPDAI